MKPNPDNLIAMIAAAPALESEKHRIFHRFFSEVHASGKSCLEAERELFRRLEEAVEWNDDLWKKAQLGVAIKDLIEFTSAQAESRPTGPSPLCVGDWKPPHFVDGDNLYRIRPWSTNQDWLATEIHPELLKYVEGLGWVGGATFIRSLGGVSPAWPYRDRRVGDRRDPDHSCLRTDVDNRRRNERRGRDRRLYNRWSSYLMGRPVLAH